MSEENIELVRRTIDLWNAREIDQALEELADDCEMDWSNSIGPLKGIYQGREGVLELWRSFLDVWDTVHWDPEAIIEVDDTRVVLVNHVRMRGRGSGVDVDATGVQLWTIEAGKAQRIKLYQSKSDALEAAGLSEWAMSEENVEATKLAVAALNRGDFEGLEELYAADAVLQDLQNAPDQPVTVEGAQAIRQTLNLWADAFDELRVDIEEYIDGPDAVVCAAHWQGQGKTSGIAIDVHQFDLYEFRKGRVIRAVLGFRSKNDALEAAGLSE